MQTRIIVILLLALFQCGWTDERARTQTPAQRAAQSWSLEAVTRGNDRELALQRLRRLAGSAPRGLVQTLTEARLLALGSQKFRNTELASAARARLSSIQPPVTNANLLAEYLVAAALVESSSPDPAGKERLLEYGQQLLALRHKEPHQYPFRAHASLEEVGTPYVATPSGQMAPGAYYLLENARQVQALALLSQATGSSEFLAAAEREGLGMMSHLVVSGKLVRGFAPRPESNGTLAEAAVVVDNFMTLHRLTGKKAYAVLAGLAAKWARDRRPTSELEKAASRVILSEVQNTPAEFYSRAQDRVRPSTYQVMDAENGKAVKKAFESMPLTYPGGTTGSTITVGRENMFWMRFDVDREDDYYFYMVFLKSEVDGGLVSVMMRIDGDKIFQVNLGGAKGRPYMDMELVEGPRHLRSGPHSFGIRFSGLLMTQPAVLDAVVVQPVVERRTLDLPDGRRLVVLNNLAPGPGRTTFSGIRPWERAAKEVLNGDGEVSRFSFESDRRRRKEYLKIPAGGLALIEWAPAPEQPEIE